MINIIRELYSIPPKSDLDFSKVGATKTGGYMNLGLEIDNQGIVDAENVTLNIYSGGDKIESYDFSTIPSDSGKMVYLSNLPVSRTIKNITLTIETSTQEYNYDNNKIGLSVTD